MSAQQDILQYRRPDLQTRRAQRGVIIPVNSKT